MHNQVIDEAKVMYSNVTINFEQNVIMQDWESY